MERRMGRCRRRIFLRLDEALHNKLKNQGCVQKSNNAESVGECQPRVCFETLGLELLEEIARNPGWVARLRGQKTPTQLLQSCVLYK